VNRRTLSAYCLVASPLVYESTRFLWPRGSEGDTATQLAAAAAHPTSQVVAGLLEGVSGWLLVPAVIGVVARLHGRGRMFGTIAGAMTVLASFGFSAVAALNAYFVVTAQQLPRPEAVSLYDHVIGSAYLVPFFILIVAGVLGQLLLTWAAFRGGLVRWWVPGLMTVGVVTTELGSSLERLSAALVYLPVLVAATLFAAALLREAPVRLPEARRGLDSAPEGAGAAAVSVAG
jgi:hypothetical protein